MKDSSTLLAIKLAHSVVWVFLVACIVAIPVAAYLGRFRLGFALIAVVLIEVLVLIVNRWRCPLTGMAARYTDERQPNFDIFLPVWVARHNKALFGTLFVGGLGYTFFKWWLHGSAS